jgi:hypothetical protein
MTPRAAWDWRREERRGVLLLKALALVAERALYGQAGPMVLGRPAAGVAEVER